MKKLLLLPLLAGLFACSNKPKVIHKKKHLIKELWNYNVTPVRLIEKTEYNEDYHITIDKDGFLVALGQKAFKSLTINVDENIYNVVYPDGKENIVTYKLSIREDNDTIFIKNLPEGIDDNTLKVGVIYKFF